MDITDFEWTANSVNTPLLHCQDCETEIAWTEHCIIRTEDIYHIDVLYVMNVQLSDMHNGVICRCGLNVGTIDNGIVKLDKVFDRYNGLQNDSDLLTLDVTLHTPYNHGTYECSSCFNPICFPTIQLFTNGISIHVPKYLIVNVNYADEGGETKHKVINCVCGVEIGISTDSDYALLHNVTLMPPILNPDDDDDRSTVSSQWGADSGVGE